MSLILNRITSVVPIGGVATLTGNTGGPISPVAGNVNLSGGTTGLSFGGSGSTETVSGTLIVGNGGTGVSTMVTPYAPVISGTTATGPLQVASTGLSTSGYVLTSTGASSLPTFQAIAVGGITWTVITIDQTAVVNNGYIANKAGTLALLLPATANIGDMIRVTGINTALGWQITQAANQQIFFGTSSTTLGATGTLTSSAIRDSVEMVCVVAGASTVWNVLFSIGNITIV